MVDWQRPKIDNAKFFTTNDPSSGPDLVATVTSALDTLPVEDVPESRNKNLDAGLRVPDGRTKSKDKS